MSALPPRVVHATTMRIRSGRLPAKTRKMTQMEKHKNPPLVLPPEALAESRCRWRGCTRCSQEPLPDGWFAILLFRDGGEPDLNKVVASGRGVLHDTILCPDHASQLNSPASGQCTGHCAREKAFRARATRW